MFTAKIINRQTTDGIIKLTVEFTNGTKTMQEWVQPQNKAGFDHWLASRLEAFNTAEEFELSTDFEIGTEVSVPVEPEPVTTPDEMAASEWAAKYVALEKAQKLSEIAVKAGRTVAPERQAEIDALAEYVDTNFKSEYINLI